MKLFWIAGWIAISAGISAVANAGGGVDVGNGVDNVPAINHSAWFHVPKGTQKMITYCKIIGEDFGLAENDLDSAIQWAFLTWENYANGDQIGSWLQDRNFIFKTISLPSCDGSEDIRFYFGANDSKVDRAKVAFYKPTAFIEKESLDPEWSKGFVWIASPKELPENDNHEKNWNTPFGVVSLRAVLLHELGHIYGNLHVPGTIMDEQLSLAWTAKPWEFDRELKIYTYKKLKIDHTNQLSEHRQYDGYLMGFQWCNGDDLGYIDGMKRILQISNLTRNDHFNVHWSENYERDSDGIQRLKSRLIIQFPEKELVINARYRSTLSWSQIGIIFSACIKTRNGELYCGSKGAIQTTRLYDVHMPNGGDYIGILANVGSNGCMLETGPEFTILVPGAHRQSYSLLSNSMSEFYSQ